MIADVLCHRVDIVIVSLASVIKALSVRVVFVSIVVINAISEGFVK